MTIILSAEQCRVIGVLLEKEITTPEQYPLSLNALTNACNQKSNREPVLSLSEAHVQNIVDQLSEMKQVTDQGAFSGRVAKYSHRFCNTEFGDLQFTQQQRAIICVMLLRGPQTPGELRTRTNRLADFANVNEIESTLDQLKNLNNSELVVKLVREPGKRESRYAHQFTNEEFMVSDENETVKVAANIDMSARVTLLEAQVAHLTTQVTELLEQLS
ncbi:MAG: hypothetical protein ACI9LM_002620 [Alteromonadaceae bacterium]|jgi:uncharacterized protein YceH (UPF0502 family)